MKKVELQKTADAPTGVSLSNARWLWVKYVSVEAMQPRSALVGSVDVGDRVVSVNGLAVASAAHAARLIYASKKLVLILKPPTPPGTLRSAELLPMLPFLRALWHTHAVACRVLAFALVALIGYGWGHFHGAVRPQTATKMMQVDHFWAQQRHRDNMVEALVQLDHAAHTRQATAMKFHAALSMLLGSMGATSSSSDVLFSHRPQIDDANMTAATTSASGSGNLGIITVPNMEFQLSEPPSVAFIVSGMCWGGANTRTTLASYVQHVVGPHGAAESSTLFLLFSGGECGAGLCRWAGTLTPTPCVEALLTGEHCRRQPTQPDCFNWRPRVLPAWWCTMRSAWAHVRLHEQSRQVIHSRVLFSRVDLVFVKSVGSWKHYLRPWHTVNIRCPDMFWALSRKMAALVLGSTLDRAAACNLPLPQGQHDSYKAHATPCCEAQRNRYISWWPLEYWVHPGVTNVSYIFSAQGAFNLTARGFHNTSDYTSRASRGGWLCDSDPEWKIKYIGPLQPYASKEFLLARFPGRVFHG